MEQSLFNAEQSVSASLSKPAAFRLASCLVLVELAIEAGISMLSNKKQVNYKENYNHRHERKELFALVIFLLVCKVKFEEFQNRIKIASQDR